MPERGVGFQPDLIAHVVETSLLIVARDRTGDESGNLVWRFHLSQSMLKIGSLVCGVGFDVFVRQSHGLGLEVCPVHVWVVNDEGLSRRRPLSNDVNF